MKSKKAEERARRLTSKREKRDGVHIDELARRMKKQQENFKREYAQGKKEEQEN